MMSLLVTLPMKNVFLQVLDERPWREASEPSSFLQGTKARTEETLGPGAGEVKEEAEF